MPAEKIVFSLPIAERQVAFDFYTRALGLEPEGEPGSDGLPEPLCFRLGESARLMLVPRGGFGWVIGDREVASGAQTECVLGLEAADEPEVRDLFDRALGAGATAISAPAAQPWGYSAAFADPDDHIWLLTAAAP